MKKIQILVFPCGSEIGLEIYRSLEFSTHFNLIGASSVNDHGKFVYANYIGNLPFYDSPDFITEICRIVKDHNIDAIYPAMDSVITFLKKNEEKLGCKVISSCVETTEICLSKSKTYNVLKNHIAVPEIYFDHENIPSYPVFLKPDVGYGSRGVLKADNWAEAEHHLAKHPGSLILEYLPGREYTVDCFTNFKSELLFVGPRERRRISNGISVNSVTMPLKDTMRKIASSINNQIEFNGAWFFQVKENAVGELVLLEIASRMGGSSAVHRAQGVNFASLSVFNAFEMPVSVFVNSFQVELDRALSNKYKLNIQFEHAYIDFDDTILVNGNVNTKLITVIYDFINKKKKVHLITKHIKDINETLRAYRLEGLFDSIIHLKQTDIKSDYITKKDSIFIDDSFAERKSVNEKLGISVFSVDMIEIF